MVESSQRNLKVVQEVLGHSAITVIRGTYSKVMPGLKEQVAEKLEPILMAIKTLPHGKGDTPQGGEES